MTRESDGDFNKEEGRCWNKERVSGTINGVLLEDFHDSSDSWDFAVRVVEECKVAFAHGTHVVAG